MKRSLQICTGFRLRYRRKLTATGSSTIRDSAVTIVGIIVVQRTVSIDITHIVGIPRVRGAHPPIAGSQTGLTAFHSKSRFSGF